MILQFFKKNGKELFLLCFLFLAMFSTLTLLFQKQVFKKRAEEKFLSISFDSSPGQPIKRIWPNFAQGGEEKENMLLPVKKEATKLQPELIRIDHLFDFGEIAKKQENNSLIFDFSDLDKRVEEIIALGATPFLSLSYFPSFVSVGPTEFPPTLNDWQLLVQNTIQRYSGKNQKGLLNVYYEVWNEPDLFGKMSEGAYYSLYRASTLAAQNCQNCNTFKIGGPAITTLKRNWLENFLGMIFRDQTRLDFISWHSYQLNPAKTLNEALAIREILRAKGLDPTIPLIISESGSVPEISSLHDSYFDASHLIAVVSLLKDSVDKLVTFEIKDGPDPQGKKFWGRWGLLTHQSFGISAKPKYYSFLYLNKLLSLSLNPIEVSPGTFAIGSTDGKENYAIVFSRLAGNNVVPLNLRLFKLLPGTYATNLYSLNSLSEPLSETVSQVLFSGNVFDFNLNAYPNAVYLLEFRRTSPALEKAEGRSGAENDLSAKIGSGAIPLVFNLQERGANINNGRIDFWYKPLWEQPEKTKHTLLETKNKDGDGLTVFLETRGFNNVSLILQTPSNNETMELLIPLGSLKNGSWYKISLVFDNQKRSLSLKIDEQQTSLSIPPEKSVSLGKLLYLGANSNLSDSAEGLMDDFIITIDNATIYQESFD